MSRKLDPALKIEAVKAINALKVMIDTDDPDYMEQVKINGDLNKLIQDLDAVDDIHYGCYCDCDFTDNGEAIPDSLCVMDPDYNGSWTDCLYASENGNKADCDEWRVVI